MYSRSKLLSIGLLTSTLLCILTEGTDLAIAGTCVAGSSCAPPPIQFIPGQRITIEVVNLTRGVIQLQQMPVTDALTISPGQVRTLFRGSTLDPNFSVIFWDTMGLALKADIIKLGAKNLRIELRPGGRPPGNRAVYLNDDGRVKLL
ncbi:MAG: hypothetical protein F6K47_27655 [Symploca sp. SIO2E6]|nr:hypothetical protein [Symploca sp. SIO2E6]